MHVITAPVKQRNFSQPRVLIVESDRDNLTYLANTLRRLGYDYLTANETMLALSLAQQEQPDSILLDLQMNQIDAIELLRTLRIDWLTRNIPVIAITTASAREETTLNTEFDRYLFKPYTPVNLQKAIAN